MWMESNNRKKMKRNVCSGEMYFELRSFYCFGVKRRKKYVRKFVLHKWFDIERLRLEQIEVFVSIHAKLNRKKYNFTILYDST